MSSRNSGRPGWADLLLVICLVALGFHFVGENLTPAAAPASLPAATAGDSPHPGHDLAEDQFVLTASVALSGDSGSLWGAPPLLLSAGLPMLAPPAPPPDR